MFRPHVGPSVFDDLETGKIDLGFHMCDGAPSSTFCSLSLYRERILLLCHPEDVLARRRMLRPSDLSGRNLLLTENGCAYRSKFDRILANGKIRPGHITEFSSVEAIKRCVAAGMGLAVLPAVAVSRELHLAESTATRWAGPSLDVVTHLSWHRDKWMSPSMAAFRELVTETLRENVGIAKGKRRSATDDEKLLPRFAKEDPQMEPNSPCLNHPIFAQSVECLSMRKRM